MATHIHAIIDSGFSLIRRGRFLAAVDLLRGVSIPNASKLTNSAVNALFADALQRVGQNERAEIIATNALASAPSTGDIRGRCHFVLGNVNRERGELGQAVEHYQKAVCLCTYGELECWAHLRLLLALSELGGYPLAISRVDEAKRALTRCGDVRPFAALHLWLSECDSTTGNLQSARKHLAIASSFLSDTDDIWLRGYFAVNSSGVHYYCANMPEARRWAEIALESALESGHCATRRAALANLGHIQYSSGLFADAERYFSDALGCCEKGGPNEIAILDNIAQVRLRLGDLHGCQRLMDSIDQLTGALHSGKRRYYSAWATQTRIQLLVKKGHIDEAKALCDSIERGDDIRRPQPRLTTATHLSIAETHLASGDLDATLRELESILECDVQIPPDLSAQCERLMGNLLIRAGDVQLGHELLLRARHIFISIGHEVGRLDTESDLHSVPLHVRANPAAGTLNRVRMLLDHKTRAELFGLEAAALLEQLGCAAHIELVEAHDTGRRSVHTFVDENFKSACNHNLQTFETVLDHDDVRSLRLVYSVKPAAASRLTALVFNRVIRRLAAIDGQSVPLHQEIWSPAGMDDPLEQGPIFKSEPMKQIIQIVNRVAASSAAVLLTGETGTGKEVLARLIHDRSSRSAMPFLAVNCAAVPRELLESQLFGYRRGAFSGAAESFQGVARAANGGTLFLDEIGEMPTELQAKLLRFVELGEIHSIGETSPTKVNLRFVFATNCDLAEAVAQGRFRQDLYHRISVVPVSLPPLRERREEIPDLVGYFSRKFAAENSREPLKIGADAMELLILYSWPGNIRQLANEIRRLVTLSDSGAYISAEQLARDIQRSRPAPALNAPGIPRLAVRLDQRLDAATEKLEREMIARALEQARGQVSLAARMLGLSRKGLYLKRVRLGLLPPIARSVN